MAEFYSLKMCEIFTVDLVQKILFFNKKDHFYIVKAEVYTNYSFAYIVTNYN